MPAVSETIVREYFELHEFLVRQHRKYIGQTRRDEDDDIDFFVLNPAPAGARSERRRFVLESADLRFIERAHRGGQGLAHGDVQLGAAGESSPEIFRFVEARGVSASRARLWQGGHAAEDSGGAGRCRTSEAARDESIALLRAKGIDAAYPFPHDAGRPGDPDARSTATTRSPTSSRSFAS